MLTLTIFLPFLAGIAALTLRTTRAVRATGLAAALLTLVCTTLLVAGFDPAGAALQWRTTVPWIPGIDSSYDIAVDGLSLALMLLTSVLITAVMVFVRTQDDDRAGLHTFLFLLMTTGLLGLFAARDLILFYVFFEIGLVPMYFIVGLWGHEDRRYAAMKFFLYTRAGSLAMLLSFLALYAYADPHTFSIPALVEAQPVGAGTTGGLVLLGMLIGFGVKLPVVPLHNWLPDAHVEAPTEGSVMLAGIQLKMGGYGILAVMLPIMPAVVRDWAWVLVTLGLLALVYGALAALAQTDFKRLVAYTSINHMGYVMLGAGAWALAESAAVRELAVTGAAYQMVSHGLLTGAMFFMVGLLQDRTGTRDLARLGGVMQTAPLYSGLLGVLAFASFGLPGFSGFIAEFQVIGATVSESLWAAVVAVLALLITTGLYLKVLMSVTMGESTDRTASIDDLSVREVAVVASLVGLSSLLGILPGMLVRLLAHVTGPLAQLGL